MGTLSSSSVIDFLNIRRRLLLLGRFGLLALQEFDGEVACHARQKNCHEDVELDVDADEGAITKCNSKANRVPEAHVGEGRFFRFFENDSVESFGRIISGI